LLRTRVSIGLARKWPQLQIIANNSDRVAHVFTAITPMSGKLPGVFLLAAARSAKTKRVVCINLKRQVCYLDGRK